MLLINELNERTEMAWTRDKETGLLAASDGAYSLFVNEDRESGTFYLSATAPNYDQSVMFGSVDDLVEHLNSKYQF